MTCIFLFLTSDARFPPLPCMQVIFMMLMMFRAFNILLQLAQFDPFGICKLTSLRLGNLPDGISVSCPVN